MPPDTFAKLPVHALINDPKKNWYRNQLQPMLHFLTTPKFDLLSYIYIINFLNLPVRALIHDRIERKFDLQCLRTHVLLQKNPTVFTDCIFVVKRKSPSKQMIILDVKKRGRFKGVTVKVCSHLTKFKPCSHVPTQTHTEIRTDIILYWRIEYWAKWVPDPFCPNFSPSRLAHC